MASGLDQNRIIDILQVIVGQSAAAGSPYHAVLAAPFSASSAQEGHIRLMTANGNSTTNGTELSGGSYVQGTGIVYTTGPSGQFASASYGSSSGSIQTNATLSQAGMPAATTEGIEIWDSAASPLRWPWGALASNVTTSSGDTFSFGSGALVETFLG